MRALASILLLLPAIAGGGSFVTGNTSLPGPKVDAKACINPDPNKCLRAQDFNALRDAANDLRDAVRPVLSMPNLRCDVEWTGTEFACKQASIVSPVAPLYAFPGCEGSGCNTRGGFSTAAGTPVVYRVTNLNESGAGSLNACLIATGPRACVFAVAGKIRAPVNGYRITSPYITIRGDTAPGMGVLIDYGDTASAGARQTTASNSCLFQIQTHDVVIRGLRVRNGYLGGWAAGAYSSPFCTTPKATNPATAVNNVVVDHTSASWGYDEGSFTIYSLNTLSTGFHPPSDQPKDITYSFLMAAEGLGNNDGTLYSKSAIFAGDNTLANSGYPDGAYSDAMVNIDLHHNVFGNSARRNPEIRVGQVRFVNNVIFNGTYAEGAFFSGGIEADVINNLVKAPGLMDGANVVPPRIAGLAFDLGNTDQIATDSTGDASIYLSGNRRYSGTVQGWGTSLFALYATAPAGQPVKRNAPLAASSSGTPITANSADDLDTILFGAGGAGHSRRLDCGGAWVTSGVRDAVDQRLADSFYNPPAEWPFAGCGTTYKPNTSNWGTYCQPKTAADVWYGKACSNYPPGCNEDGFPIVTPIASTTVCAANSRDNTSCVCADSDLDGIPDYWESAFCGSATGCTALGTTVSPPWTNIEAYMSGLKVAP